MLIEGIIIAKGMLVQNGIHHAAAFAAEGFFVDGDIYGGAGFATVITESVGGAR